MIKLMLGTNFDPELPAQLAKLNEESGSFDAQVVEVYGSIKDFKIFGTARPNFRLPNVKLHQLESRIREYRKLGIQVNYTENTPIINKKDIDVHTIHNRLAYLHSIGVTRITLAHPLAMEIANEAYPFMPIEISTIYALNSVYQLRELKKRCPNINKICMDVDRNRDFKFLRMMVCEADDLEVDIELLANEFCLADCVDRVQCYNDHVQVSSDQEAALFNRYPMGRCITQRTKNPVEWLRARFILPQWMGWYEEIVGISNFKITGRTHPTKYILWVAEQYLRGRFYGNLLELWADVKNIKRVSQGKDHLIPSDYIDCSKLTEDILWKYREDRLMENLDEEYKYLSQYV